MKMSFKPSKNIILSSAWLLLVAGCGVNTTPATQPPMQAQQGNVKVTLDPAGWGTFGKQLETALTNKLGGLMQKTAVYNFVGMTPEYTTSEGKNVVFLNFQTADGKVYRTRVDAANISAAQIEKFKSLKSAVLVGVMPIQNQSNHFFFQQFDSYNF